MQVGSTQSIKNSWCLSCIDFALILECNKFKKSKNFIELTISSWFYRTIITNKFTSRGPTINDVGNFSGFLTFPSPCRQFYSTIHWQFWPIFDPSSVAIAKVVYGRPLIHIFHSLKQYTLEIVQQRHGRVLKSKSTYHYTI